MLHEKNSDIRILKYTLEAAPSPIFAAVVNADKRPPDLHAGRYNASTWNEIAAVLQENNTKTERRFPEQGENSTRNKRDPQILRRVEISYLVSTYNPKWLEITCELLLGQSQHRPDSFDQCLPT